MKIESKEKDMLISQLKACIFELQQHEKDYDQLNEKYRIIQNDFSLLNEEKLKLEYELREKEDNHARQICDHRMDNENLQLELNEKSSVNKKLFAENDLLMKQLRMKDEEICDLKDRLNELMDQFSKSEDNRNELDSIVKGLNEVKDSQTTRVNNLFEDNKKLSKLCQEQDKSIKITAQEKIKMISQLDEANYDNNNLIGKLQSRENNLNYTQAQLEDSKQLTIKLEETLKDYERQFDFLKNEINSLKISLDKERRFKEQEEKKNYEFERVLRDREKEINCINEEINQYKLMNRKTNDDKTYLQIENDKLRNHIIILTQQNEKIIAEIENIIEQDDQMKEALMRKDTIVALLNTNKTSIEKSLNNLEDFLNRSSNSISKSPHQYTYNRTSSPKNMK